MRFLRSRTEDQSLLAICPSEHCITSAMVSHPAGSRPRLEACGVAEVADQQTLASTLHHLANEPRYRKLSVTSVLTPDTYSVVLVEKPEVPAGELRAATRWRVRDLIDFHIDDAVIDVFDVPSRRGGSAAKSMYAVVAKSSAVKQRADLLLDAGFGLQVLDITELALRNIASRLPENEAGVVLIHLAEGYGIITVIRDSQLYLSRRLLRGAEVLLSADGSGLSAEVEGWLDSIVIEVQRSLDYYESHFAQSGVAGVVLGPLPWAHSGITDYLASQLGLRTRVLALEEVIDLTTAMDSATEARCFIAVGAALRKGTEQP